MARAEWRLLTGPAESGPRNMAVDEALLQSVIEGRRPTVRFYTWSPPTLSLGVNQSVHEIDREELARRGFGLVRRPTGGRAVLHQHELTYAVAAPENEPRVSGGVIESYRKISAALVEGLREMGVPVSLAEPDPDLYREMTRARRESERDPAGAAELEHGAVCFSTASAYELGVGRRKLVGSAQARRGGALLQHGSILLDIDWDAWVASFAYASDRGRERVRESLPGRMTSLREELGREVGAEEVEAALTEAFAHTLFVDFTPNDLTAEERSLAAELEERYASEVWTAKM
jgi:lipoyl(octanoyl) transferase